MSGSNFKEQDGNFLLAWLYALVGDLRIILEDVTSIPITKNGKFNLLYQI